MAIKWGGRVFNSSAELAKWLANRKRTYADWAAKHPGAAGRLDPGPARPPVGSYTDQINNEGIFAAQNAQAAANTAVSRSDAAAAINAGAIDLGAAPPGVELDPVTRSLAERNPYSQYGLIDRQATRSHGRNAADAAARGVIQSGGYALRGGDIEFDRGHQRFNALRDFLGTVAQSQRNIAETTQEGANDVYGNLGEATDRIMSSSFRPTGAGPTTPAAGSTPWKIPGTTIKGGFVSAPAGGYASEADRQQVIAHNTALGRANPGVIMGKNGVYQNNPKGAFTAPVQWIKPRAQDVAKANAINKRIAAQRR